MVDHVGPDLNVSPIIVFLTNAWCKKDKPKGLWWSFKYLYSSTSRSKTGIYHYLLIKLWCRCVVVRQCMLMTLVIPDFSFVVQPHRAASMTVVFSTSEPSTSPEIQRSERGSVLETVAGQLPCLLSWEHIASLTQCLHGY